MNAESFEQRKTCPACGAKVVTKRDGIFQWKACPKCKWDVFK